MINVNSLYIRVKDLSQKNRAGYFSVDEYNRHLRDAQNLLFEYYAEEFEEEKEIGDNLRPFIVSVTLPITDYFCTMPADYRHKIDLGYRLVLNDENCGVNPSANIYPIQFYKSEEWINAQSSPIRKGNLAKKLFNCRFVNGKIEVSEKFGNVEFVYLRNPANAVMGYTVNSTTLEEVYDASTSVQSEFLEQDETNLSDIILFLLGIQIRESALLQFVDSKRKILKD